MKIVEIQKKVDTEEFYGFGPEYETRFAIAEDDGKIVDDAQGYGYKTKEKAVKAMWWKFKGGESKSNAKVEWWRGNIGLLRGIYKFLDYNAKEIMIGDVTDEDIEKVCMEKAENAGVELPKDMLNFALGRNGSKMLYKMLGEEKRKKKQKNK
jgi:hypothetical protein